MVRKVSRPRDNLSQWVIVLVGSLIENKIITTKQRLCGFLLSADFDCFDFFLLTVFPYSGKVSAVHCSVLPNQEASQVRCAYFDSPFLAYPSGGGIGARQQTLSLPSVDTASSRGVLKQP